MPNEYGKGFEIYNVPNTAVNLLLNREEITTYINENLTNVFREGAGQKSLDNFFKWFDRIEKWMQKNR